MSDIDDLRERNALLEEIAELLNRAAPDDPAEQLRILTEHTRLLTAMETAEESNPSH